MRVPSLEELEELAALAYLFGRSVRRECDAGRCGSPVAIQAAAAAGHAAAVLALALGELGEPHPPWVKAAVARTAEKTAVDFMARAHPPEGLRAN